jgi:hypothetical protein
LNARRAPAERECADRDAEEQMREQQQQQLAIGSSIGSELNRGHQNDGERHTLEDHTGRKKSRN